MYYLERLLEERVLNYNRKEERSQKRNHPTVSHIEQSGVLSQGEVGHHNRYGLHNANAALSDNAGFDRSFAESQILANTEGIGSIPHQQRREGGY